MKGFYITAVVITVAMALSPFQWIKGEDLERFKGKVVSYNTLGSKINSIDPATCGDTTSASIQGNFYEGLYTYHYLKRPPTVIPQLAQSMPMISDDGLTYTISIKKGIRYSRNPCFGEDKSSEEPWATRTVKADDFVLAFKRIADYHVATKLSLAFIQGRIQGIDEYRQKTQLYEKGDFSRYDKEDISGIKALDDHTLRITLKKVFPQFIYVLAMHSYCPIPRELVDYHLSTQSDGQGGRVAIPMDERATEIRDREAVVSTGPYVLTTWVRGGKLIMERNGEFRDDYYPTEGAPGDKEAGFLADAGKKVPFIDVKHLTFVQEENPAWMLFLTNLRDTAGIPPTVFSSVIGPSRELTDDWVKRGIRLTKNPSPAIYWFAFNMEDPVLGASKALRQALCLSFDVDRYVEVIYNGRGKRAVNMIPSTFAGHEEAGPGPYAKLDLAAARKKIVQAKKELVAAGVIEPGEAIPTLVLDMPGRDEHFRRVAEFTAGQLKKIGVTIKPELNDWPTLQEKVHNKQCQMYAMGWHADYPDAENFLQLYYTPNIKLGTNNTNYSSRRFDQLFERASTLVNEKDRVPLYVQMARILSEDCPVLLLSEPISFGLQNKWVMPSKAHPVGYGMGKYMRIDVKQRAAAGGRP